MNLWSYTEWSVFPVGMAKLNGTSSPRKQARSYKIRPEPG